MLESNELPEKVFVLCSALISFHVARLLFVIPPNFYAYRGISSNQQAGLHRNVSLQVS